MLIALMVATGIFLVVALFMGCLFPFISMIECGLSHDHTGGKKVFWIIAHLLFWALAALLYGLFGTQSERLHGFTKKAVFLLLLSFGVVAGIGYKSPELRAQMIERMDAMPAFAESTSEKFGVELPDLKQAVEQAQADVLELKEVSFGGNEPTQADASKDVRTLREEALQAMQDQQFERAQDLIEQVVDRDGESIENLTALARIYQASGETEVAREQWEELLARLTGEIFLKPTSAKLHYQRGRCFQYMQESEAAVAEFRKAVTLDPVDSTYRSALEEMEPRREPSVPPAPAQPQAPAEPEVRKPLPPVSPVYQNLRDNPFVK